MGLIRLPNGAELAPVGSLRPYARNARTHSQEQVKQIAASMIEFGFTAPILADETGNILAGHGRLEAALSLGMDAVPVVRVEGLSDAQRRAYILADNKIALNAGWDNDLLIREIRELEAIDYNLALTGFSSSEIDALVASVLNTEESGADEEETPEPPANPVTVLGDIWLLGDHRLVCGDSTTVGSVDAALAGTKPHLMVTDPPYGVEYDASWRAESGLNRAGAATGKVLNDNRADWREAWALFPGDVAYVWCAPGPLNCTVHDSLVAAGYPPRMQIVWAKSQLVIGRGHYHAQHENCWYAVRKGAKGHWSGDRKQSTLWKIDKPQKSETGHSTQKPVECMRRPIVNNSERGEIVYDPFLGSGTTIIAAESVNRRCYGIELSPAYCDVIVQRWEEFTGGKAKLQKGADAAA